MAYKRTSHLRATPITNGYTELYVPPLTPDFTRVEEFVISQKYVNRPDLLSYELYGDARFWWLFPIYNKNSIVDPIGDFTLGKRIVVPRRDFVAGI
jgi:hypothetical protein